MELPICANCRKRVNYKITNILHHECFILLPMTCQLLFLFFYRTLIARSVVKKYGCKK